jgi:hypothetical protein
MVALMTRPRISVLHLYIFAFIVGAAFWAAVAWVAATAIRGWLT